MPQFQLSTIIGLAATIFVAIQHAFPDQPWLSQIAAAAALVVADEKKPS